MGNSESVNSDSRDDSLYQSSGYGAPSGAYYPDPPAVYRRNPAGSNSEGYNQHPPPVYDRKPRGASYEHKPSRETNSEPQASSCPVSLVCHDKPKKPRSSYIADNFSSLDEVVDSLREAGLESSNLILGIDFTKSNEWTGKRSFHRKSLHAIGSQLNPYEQAISIIGPTLSPFDEDNLIPCFGFGDLSTHDQWVFSFYPDDRPCQGFEEALKRYREIVPHLKLSGPTSFAPIIDAAINIVEKNSRQYHVLVIIADGQVTKNDTLPAGQLSPQEQATINAIVAASEYPLSIILVGVGDGPWDGMQQFDDNIPQRAFDNFQFVNFTKIISENLDMAKKETAFALAALMEIPFQYRATLSLPYAESPYSRRKPLPPPHEVTEQDNAVKSITQTPSSAPADATVPPSEQVCPICLTNPKDMAFGCGHLTCKDCGVSLASCPLCREPIKTRIRLYS
ncbi:calcium-binding protein [Lithospermum erythrorhizon]|uniref:Calcium-binding protein n=1 Tax=Lithospermum erythrorhizon TaxID=34254 RepID=A0AAV3RDC5_LITER